MPDNNKRAALIAEGMTEAEADYMTTGGSKELTPPPEAADPGAAEPAAAPASPGADAQADAGAAGAAAPLAAAADDDDDAPPSDPNATIPYQKYARDKQRLRAQLRERDDRLNATSTELGDLRQKWARVDERLRIFQEASAPADPQAGQPKPKPDRETDPFGYMAWLEERIESLAPQVEQVTARTQERDAYTALTSTFRADAQEYARTAPDFLESTPGARDGAYHFLMKNRDAELLAAGYTDPNERLRIITLDERDIVARALHARQNNPQAPGPAQVLYNLATARGYQKRAAVPAPGAGNGAARPAANGAGNGAAAPAAPAAAPSVTQQVESIQRGQAASRSLSTGGGAPVPQGIDLAKLAAMDDAEYLDYMRSLTPAQRREYHSLIGAPK